MSVDQKAHLMQSCLAVPGSGGAEQTGYPVSALFTKLLDAEGTKSGWSTTKNGYAFKVERNGSAMTFEFVDGGPHKTDMCGPDSLVASRVVTGQGLMLTGTDANIIIYNLLGAMTSQ